MDCVHCNQKISGDAVVRGEEIMHQRCRKAADAKARGLPFACPQCKAEGVVDYIARHGEWGYTDDVWAKRECELCHGQGFTPKEMVQVPVKFEWRPKA